MIVHRLKLSSCLNSLLNHLYGEQASDNKHKPACDNLAPLKMLVVIMVCVLFGLSPSLANDQCFIRAEEAYAYLLDQEQKSNIKQQLININQASEAELVTLSGIGSQKAQNIILYRETMGRFVSIDELNKIKGIGQKTIDKNRHRLTVADSL